jgi:hypothetical protein
MGGAWSDFAQTVKVGIRCRFDAVGEIGVVSETRRDEGTKTRKQPRILASFLPLLEFTNSIRFPSKGCTKSVRLDSGSRNP